jgi:energy-converting hydrogenase A subunit R
MLRVQLDTGCQGPLALNDNAFELCRDFIKPQGDRFFKQVSRYDDYLADVARRPGYKAGDTLKLILPFLKAQGLTNAALEAYCQKTVTLMPGAVAAFKFLHDHKFPIFEISTSYRQFAEAVGLKLGFEADRIFATDLDLDRYTLSAAEAQELQLLQWEIVSAVDVDLPPGAASPADLSAPVMEAIVALDRIFWERLPAMDIGAIYREVNPLGGPEKAQAVTDSLAVTGLGLADTIYVGDSITDVAAFEAVRAGGGLTISFNGNRYAVNAAEVVVVSNSAWSIALITAIVQTWGKDGVLELAMPETRDKSRSLVLPEEMINHIFGGLDGSLLNIYLSQSADRERLTRESLELRAQLRGGGGGRPGVSSR